MRASPLPAEIAFLTQHGVAADILQDVAARALRLGVEPARQLIASGALSEDAFYRALATELKLPFRDRPPAFRAGGGYEAIRREGIATTVDGDRLRFVLAPTGPALRRMIEAGPRQRPDLAVTTPGAFDAALRQANAPALAQRISGRDAAGLARFSARTGSSRPQRLAAGIGVAVLATCGGLAPFEAFIGLALLLSPVFLAITVLRLAGICEPEPPDLWRTQRWRIDDRRLPVYTVAVPLLREESVLPQLIAALGALDYPAAKLDIRLLVERDDIGLRSALSGYDLPAHITVTVVPAGQPRTKPRALNLALLEARGELFTIYDAEDVPDPQQLRLAAARFLRAPPELACLQARLVIDNFGDGWLQALFALEYAGLFDVVNPAVLRCGLPIMLGGTSNHFRTEAVRAVGGWDSWNVTEDADIGLRLVRAGYRIADLPSATLEEAPPDLQIWLKQRARWIKGYVQTLISHLHRPHRLLNEAGLSATLAFLALAMGSVVSALGYPFFVLGLGLAWLDGSLLRTGAPFAGLAAALTLVLMVAGIIGMVAPPALGAWRRGSPGLLKWLPLLPFYYVLVSVAAWLALVEYAGKRFVWNKTPHGLARSSRYRTVTGGAAIPPLLPPEAARC